MSEPKGPFDAAFSLLRANLKGWVSLRGEYERAGKSYAKACAQAEANDLESAIRVLEDWPKWEPLIEAAQRKINIQAMDEGLWFVAITASEEYLQNALRELHAIIRQAIAGYEKGQS